MVRRHLEARHLSFETFMTISTMNTTKWHKRGFAPSTKRSITLDLQKANNMI